MAGNTAISAAAEQKLNSQQPKGDNIKKCPMCKREFVGPMVVCSHDGTLLMQVKQDQVIGTILQDKYHVLSEIGRGGMSIVYKARHEMMDKQVAIKMLQKGLMNDQTSIKRFQQEAQAASCLAHQNVITIFDFGVSPITGQPYLVMDFLEGHSLADVIKAENHIAAKRAADIFVQACDALEHAHQKGVLHRDLKSSNIMLIQYDGSPDFVKVVDFGIAKLMPNSGKQAQNLTQTGEIFGSPIYMSPEQCMGMALDARSDIYSMGTMLYETLTGQPPLLGANIIDTMQMHVESVPPVPSRIRSDLQIPKPIEMICLRALEKKPENRFQSMGEFRDALMAILPLLPSAAPSPGRSSGRTGTKQNIPNANRQGITGSSQYATGGANAPRLSGGGNSPGGPNYLGPGAGQGGAAGAGQMPGQAPQYGAQQGPGAGQNQGPNQGQNQAPRPDRFAPPAQAGQNPAYATGAQNYQQGQMGQNPQASQSQMPQQIPQGQMPGMQGGSYAQGNPQQYATGGPGQNPQQYPGGTQGQNPQYGTGAQGQNPQQYGAGGQGPNQQQQQYGTGAQPQYPQQYATGAQGQYPQQTAPGAQAQYPQQYATGAQGQYPQQFATGAQGQYPQPGGTDQQQQYPQQYATGAQGQYPQQTATGAQTQYPQQQYATGAQQNMPPAGPGHLMQSSTGVHAPAPVALDATLHEDSLFGNPSQYGEGEGGAFQMQGTGPSPAGPTTSMPSNPVRHVPDHLPSKRINSDYSDLLVEKAADKKGGTAKAGPKIPQKLIHAPETPKNKTSLIILIAMVSVSVILVITLLCLGFLNGVRH